MYVIHGSSVRRRERREEENGKEPEVQVQFSALRHAKKKHSTRR
jgi:hypothetical protein